MTYRREEAWRPLSSCGHVMNEARQAKRAHVTCSRWWGHGQKPGLLLSRPIFFSLLTIVEWVCTKGLSDPASLPVRFYFLIKITNSWLIFGFLTCSMICWKLNQLDRFCSNTALIFLLNAYMHIIKRIWITVWKSILKKAFPLRVISPFPMWIFFPPK